MVTGVRISTFLRRLVIWIFVSQSAVCILVDSESSIFRNAILLIPRPKVLFWKATTRANAPWTKSMVSIQNVRAAETSDCGGRTMILNWYG